MSGTLDWPAAPTAWPLGDGRFALAHERPESVSALCAVVAGRIKDGAAIYPQGGRTALDYGGVPRLPGIALDLTGMGRVIDYPAADMTITVEAGTTIGELQRVLGEQGQRLPLDVPDADRATLGGVYATNVCGPRRFGWGRPRDQIIGVSFVNSSGELVKGGGRVVKNVAGYDFPKLLTGSMGTLGALVQMTLRVRPKPESSALVFARFERSEPLDTALAELNTSDTRPVAIEVLNATASRWLDEGGRLGLTGDGWLLVLGFEDNAASVAWQVERLREELRTDLVLRRDEEALPYWDALTRFPAIEPKPRLTFVANVRPSDLMGAIERLEAASWSIQAHAGNGIVVGHASEELSQEALFESIEQLRDRAVRSGGNLVLARCPTEWKDRLRVWGSPRGDWPIMERIKRAFDPSGLLNPGRFISSI